MGGIRSILILLLMKAFAHCAIQDASDVDGNTNGYWLDEPPRRSNPHEIKYGWRLIILPSPGNSANTIVKRLDEVLNLTCIAEYYNDGTTNFTSDLKEDQLFKLSWHIPIMPQNSKNRVSFVDMHNSKILIVDHLKESDAGEYECQAKALSDSDNSATFMESVKIIVKPRKGSCSDPSFLCSSGECIAKRFLCDGMVDCKDKTDESLETCGSYHPCDGKLKCEDGRCISAHFCCDRTLDKNCSTWVVPPCCKQLKQIQLSMDMSQYPPQPHHYNEMSFLQTTIYTVIGCAMAFMFIITIMVVAICRVHLKRTAMAHPQMRGHHGTTTQDSFGNIFFNSAGGGLPYNSAASGLLVTYNINNGVQFMGRPLNPPPYSELARIPPREGPPPPYCSIENIAVDQSPSVTPNPDPSSGNNINSEPNPILERQMRIRGRELSRRTQNPEDSRIVAPLLNDDQENHPTNHDSSSTNVRDGQESTSQEGTSNLNSNPVGTTTSTTTVKDESSSL